MNVYPEMYMKSYRQAAAQKKKSLNYVKICILLSLHCTMKPTT